jgi:hypothetical protein
MTQQHYDYISPPLTWRLDARLHVLTVSAYQLGVKLFGNTTYFQGSVAFYTSEFSLLTSATSMSVGTCGLEPPFPTDYLHATRRDVSRAFFSDKVSVGCDLSD